MLTEVRAEEIETTYESTGSISTERPIVVLMNELELIDETIYMKRSILSSRTSSNKIAEL